MENQPGNKIGEKRAYKFQIDPRFFSLILPALGDKGVVTVRDSVEVQDILRTKGSIQAAIRLTEILKQKEESE